MKISAVFHQPAATSIGIGRLCWLSIVLIALISSCFILTTVRIPKRAVKGQRAGMSNGSKSVDDGWSGVVTKNRVKKRKENVQIESCIAFSQLDNQILFLILEFLD